jgi:hypothetical protein
MNHNPSNAYLLFYERKNFYNEELKTIPNLYHGLDNIVQKAEKKPGQSLSPQELKVSEKIDLENIKETTINYLFERDKLLPKFFFNTLSSIRQQKRQLDAIKPSSPDTPPTAYQVQFGKFSILYFLTVAIRKNNKKVAMVVDIYKEIKWFLRHSYELSEWLLRGMTYSEILTEFMLDCPIGDIHYFIFGMIKTALKTAHA